MNPRNIPSKSVSSDTHVHPSAHKIFSKPSVWYRNRCRLVHLSHPKTSQGYAVSLSYLAPSLFSKPFTRVIVFSVKERLCEDTEQGLKERVYRSALSAVDLRQIKYTFSDSAHTYPAFS
jgi:hypothetical protein